MENNQQQNERFFNNLQGYLMGDASEAYSDRVMELAYDPLNVGEIENPDGFARITGDCGDTIQIGFHVTGGVISDIRFLTDGCGATLACGSAVTDLALKKSPYQAGYIYAQTVIQYLDGLPASHMHCAVLAVQTLKKALRHYEKTHHITYST